MTEVPKDTPNLLKKIAGAGAFIICCSFHQSWDLDVVERIIVLKF